MSSVAEQLEIAVCDALTEAVANGQMPLVFVPSNKIQTKEIENLETVQVVVLATEQDFARQSRATTQQGILVSVTAVKKVGFDDAGSLRHSGRCEMLELAESIGDLIAQPLSGFEGAGPSEPSLEFDTSADTLLAGIVMFSVSATYYVLRRRRTGDA